VSGAAELSKNCKKDDVGECTLIFVAPPLYPRCSLLPPFTSAGKFGFQRSYIIY